MYNLSFFIVLCEVIMDVWVVFFFVLQIEYTLVVLDHDAKKPQLSLVGPQILQTLQRPETDDPDNHHTKWRPEYASYMIEGLHMSTYIVQVG